MKILSIGNSFSMDAQRWIPELAASLGQEVLLGDLYIGGCSLERHADNMRTGAPAYEYSENNRSLGTCRLKTGLIDRDWDVVTLQQASHFSGLKETYYPYIGQLADYVHSLCPKAKIYVHETWAYEYNSTHPQFANYGCDRHKMHSALCEAYEGAASSIGAPLIPVGEAVALARQNPVFDPEKGGMPLTRDGFHLSYQYGRYLAAAVWCETLLGLDSRNSSFAPEDREFIGHDQNGAPLYRPLPETRADEEKLKLLRAVAHEAAQKTL